MKVQIITNDNGYGLSQDVTVLREAFARLDPSITTTLTHWRTPGNGRYDLNVFLELLNPQFFSQAPRNVLVPNPEWCIREWEPIIPRLSAVWVKTRDAERIFRGRNKSVVYTGWSSRDRGGETAIPWHKKLLHVAGASSAKGTPAVLRAMAALPDVELTMIGTHKPAQLPENVAFHTGLKDEAVDFAMRTHKIHLCPSSYEGFGHYINEARSARAVIITTNAAPMNELVTASFGLGAATISVSNQNMAQHKHVDPASLVEMIKIAMDAPDSGLANLGERAREAFLQEREQFTRNLGAALRA